MEVSSRMNKPSSAPKPPDPIVLAGFHHLENSSRALTSLASTTAAYLGAERNAVLSKRPDLLTGNQESKHCHACGSVLIPGWSCKKYRPKPGAPLEKKPKKNLDGIAKSKKTKSSEKDVGSIVYECDLCHCITRFEPPKKKVKAMVKTTTDQAATTWIPSTPVPMTAAPEKPTSMASEAPSHAVVDRVLSAKPATEGVAKKRAKKNKAGGLAALLAKNKSESASPAAFDLMDFMKSA